MSTVEELKMQRRQIKGSITRHETAVNRFKNTDDVLLLEIRLAELTDNFKTYNEIQGKIEILQEASDANYSINLEAENDEDRDKVETQYFNLVTKIKPIFLKLRTGINSENKDVTTASSPTIINITKNGNSQESVTNLKPLPLPTFSGKHSEWINFYESFTSLVDNDASISDIRKFHYLRSCLKDEAFRTIESLPISSGNYENAKKLLQKRFKNTRLIVTEHVTNILNIAPVTRPSVCDTYLIR